MTGNGKGNLKSDDMDFLELAKKRFSARSYRPDKVEKEKTDYILECARVAPSAVNRQPWRFLVIESDEKRRLVQECYSRDWLKEAPLYIVVCAEYPAAWTRKYDGKNHGMPPLPWSISVLPRPMSDSAAAGYAISMSRS